MTFVCYHPVRDHRQIVHMSAKRPKLYLVFFILAVLGTVVPAAFLLGSAYYSEHR